MTQQSVRFVDKGRRTINGQVCDVIDYTFEVTCDKRTCIVNVGITGTWHDEIPTARRRLAHEELVKVAREWLSISLAEGAHDPLAYDEFDRMILVLNPVMDYFVNYGKIPDHI